MDRRSTPDRAGDYHVPVEMQLRAPFFHHERRPRRDLTRGGDGMDAGEQDEARSVEQQKDEDRADGAEEIFQEQPANPFPA